MQLPPSPLKVRITGYQIHPARTLTGATGSKFFTSDGNQFFVKGASSVLHRCALHERAHDITVVKASHTSSCPPGSTPIRWSTALNVPWTPP